nr:hypothetical protein [Mucilaginibacter sp. L294]
MDFNHELIGTVVHIHPKVICLLSKQNHVGVISEANVELDNYYVDFEDRFTGLYSAATLTTLLPTDSLLKNIRSLESVPQDILNSIEIIAKSNEVMDKINLMRLLRDNPEAYKLCTQPLQEHNAQALNNQNRRTIF